MQPFTKWNCCVYPLPNTLFYPQHRLQEQTLNPQKTPPPGSPLHRPPPPSSLGHPSPNHPQTTPPAAGSGGLNADVARWIEERDILLQTGVYSGTDPTIQRLDSKIRVAMTQLKSIT